MVRAVPVAVALAALAVLSGCGDDGSSTSTSAPTAPTVGHAGPVTLSATATRSSLFDSQRTFRLELVNEGETEVTIDTIQLRSGRFEELDPSPRDTQLGPGRRLLLPLPFGESVCPAADEPDVVVAAVGGVDVEVPLAQDPPSVLDDLHADECDQQAVRDAAAVMFGEDWEVTGPRSARGRVEVEATGDVDVRVHAIGGNIVFGVRLDDGVLPSAAGFPVELVVDRCDTHALIESKRTFSFPLEVVLDGGRPITYVLKAEVGTPARDVLAERIQACIG